MKKRVLVTGGAGFIGSFITDELLERGHEVTVFDNLEPQVHLQKKLPPYYNKEARFLKGDIRDYSALEKALVDQEWVFHYAAAVGVGQSQYEIKRYTDVNVGGTANLLDVLANNKHKVEKVVVAASMSSYGEGLYLCNNCAEVRPELRKEKDMQGGDWEPLCPKCQRRIRPIPTPEEAYQNINSIYSLTKKVQEDMVLNIGKTYNIPVVALRYFNVYGPRQSLSNPYTGVAAIFLSRLKNDKAPIVYEDGLQSRDFISVHDVVRATVMVMERKEADYNVFNIGSGQPRTILEVAETLATVLGKEHIRQQVTYKFRKGDVRHCFADISKVKKTLGFTPRVDFTQGMKELIAWSKTESAEDRFDHATQELVQKGLL